MVKCIDAMTIANLLPPFFVVGIIATVWSIYVGHHLLPLLQLNVPAADRNAADAQRGWAHFAFSQPLSAMLMICYFRAVFVHPGTVPDEPEWVTGVPEDTPNSPHRVLTREVKINGERRWCKWCQKFKPDRCHHCRICKKCVLKMDHHCPWIMNCVGFRNHKYFFLLVCYAAASCIFITITMCESIQRAVNEETPSKDRFILVLGMVLSTLMCVLMVGFLGFHAWLMFKGMTTIEWCEKMLREVTNYDQGAYKNVKAVLGPHPWLWWLPFSPPVGDGLYFYRQKRVSKFAESPPEWTGERAALA